MACERNKRRSEKFFVNRGPVLGSCKTPLTQNALSCLFFRKKKSEEHIVRVVCSDTPVQLQSDECVRVTFPSFRTTLLSAF